MWKSKYGHPKVHHVSQLPKPVFIEVVSCADGEYIKCTPLTLILSMESLFLNFSQAYIEP